MSIQDEYSVLGKAAKEESTSDEFGLGAMMMAYHHTPSPSCYTGFPSSKDISCSVAMGEDLYEVVGASVGVNVGDFVAASGSHHLHPLGESGSAALLSTPGEGVANAGGFSFINPEWKQMDGHAMLQKYLMMGIPVASNLLLPPKARNLPSDPNGLASLSLYGSNDLKASGKGDLERGRCKRTDGKKWRCSRDAAPDQKYCERHLHRGRPRSRKPVERLPDDNTISNINTICEPVNKKTRLLNATPSFGSGFLTNETGIASHLVGINSIPLLQNPNLIGEEDKIKARELNWLVNQGSFPPTRSVQDQYWQDHSVENSSTDLDEPFDATFLSNLGLIDNSNCFLNIAPRFIADSWPKSSPIGTILTEAGTCRILDNMTVNDSHDLGYCSWTAPTTPGGPLAEALHLTSASAAAYPSSPFAESGGDLTVSSPATAASSPSGILQKSLLSDSSGNSSPIPSSSTTNCSEIALLWLDQSRGNLASTN